MARIPVTVIGTNLVFDYGSEERARAALETLPGQPALDVERLARIARAVADAALTKHTAQAGYIFAELPEDVIRDAAEYVRLGEERNK